MAHNDFFNNSDLDSLPRGATARAEAVDSKFDSVSAGFEKLPSENEFNRGTRNYAVTTGSGGAYIVASTHVTSYNDGQELEIKVNHSNPAGGTSVNVNAKGATSILLADGSNLPLNSMVTDGTYSLRYNSTLSGYVLQTGASAVLTSGTAATTSIADAGSYFTDPGSGKQVETALQEVAADISINALTANQFRAHEAPTPNMTVVITAGKVQSGTTITSIAQQTTTALVAPATNPRIDRIVIDSSTGIYSVITGTENASPVAPALSSRKIAVCQVLLQTATTSITNSIITDERAFNFDKGINWSFKTLFGTGLNITGAGVPALAALNGTDVAFIDGVNKQLRTYRFNGSTWSQVGTGLPITGVEFPALATLNGTDVALVDIGNKQLRTYRFNGSTWSQVGTGLNITGAGVPALAALNGTDVAFIDSVNDQLRNYRFNGSTWSQVGASLTIAGAGSPALAALNGTDVAFIDSVNDQLRNYRFNGSTWSQVGTGLPITGVESPALAALNGTDVAFIDSVNDQLRNYRFNGSTWSQVGTGVPITGVESPALAALNGTDVAFIDNGNDQLRTYKSYFDV